MHPTALSQELIDQLTGTGTAHVTLPRQEHGKDEIARARSRLTAAAESLGAKIRTAAVEADPRQGVTEVVGEIVHGKPRHVDGCYPCTQTAQRLARIHYLYQFDGNTGCSGSLHRIIDDDPEQTLRLRLVARHLPDASRATWLALKMDGARKIKVRVPWDRY